MSLSTNFDNFFDHVKKSIAALFGKIEDNDTNTQQQIVSLNNEIAELKASNLALTAEIATLKEEVTVTSKRIEEGLAYILDFNTTNNIEIN